jgi:CRP/FNR family transcriptional regulator, cyclic AMP receptor protein
MSSHLLDTLGDEERREILAAARRRRFKRNEVVFHDGDPGDALHLVVEGHFAIRITTALGDQAMIRVFGPADYFGELAILSPGSRRGSAIALDGGETLSLHRDDLEELRAKRPNINEALTQALVAEVRRLSVALIEALYVPVERRVWLRLIDLVELFGGDAPVVIPLTQDDIAQLAGTTRPTANRATTARSLNSAPQQPVHLVPACDPGRAGISALSNCSHTFIYAALPRTFGTTHVMSSI